METTSPTRPEVTTEARHAAPFAFPVGRVAGAVTGLFVLAVAYVVVPGGLYVDDFRAQAYAVGQPFWAFIVDSNGTHLSPGARTADWLQSRLWPLEHWPAVVYTLLVAAALGAVTWRLLRLLVPQDWAALTGLVLALSSASLVPGLAWYRQALTTMTALVLVLLALDAALRFLRGGARWWAALSVGGTGVALGFSERALVVPVVVLAAGLLLAPGLPGRMRVRRLAVLLVPIALVNLVFLAFYGNGDYDHADLARPTVDGFVLSTARSVFVDQLPALVGGPVLWRRGGISYAYANTPLWVVVPALTALTALLVLAWRRRPATRRADQARGHRPTMGQPTRIGLVALSYVLPIYAILYVGRVSRASVVSVDDLRLYPDVSVFVAITLAAVLGSAVRPPRHGRALRAGVTGLVVIAVGTTTSWVGFARYWHQSTTTAYVATLRADLVGNKAPVIPTPVPDAVVPAWVQPDFSTASLVQLLAPGTEASLVDGRPVLVAADGHLRPASLGAVATATNARKDFCGNGLTAGTDHMTISFATPAPAYREGLLEARVLVTDTTTLDFTVIDAEGVRRSTTSFSRPRLTRGPHTVVVPVPVGARVSAVEVRRGRADAGVCVSHLSVVVPRAGR